MAFNKHDISRNVCQLFGGQAKQGYDWWWHSFTARNSKTGEERPFFSEFFLCNPELGSKEPVLGQLPENQAKGIRPSYLMVKLGCWGEDAIQLHRFFAWDDIQVNFGVPFSVKADDCELSETALKAHAKVTKEEAEKHPEWMCDAGEISMDLKIHKITAFNVGYGAGSLFRRLQLFEMFWHAEGMKTQYGGTVTLNGEEYTITPETSYGYADKNWGKDFTSPWVWLSSNNLTSELTGKKLTDSVFDIGGGCPKVGFIKLPRKLLSAFWYEGKPYEFNFSKFWTFCRTKFDCREENDHIIWHVEQTASGNRMVADVTCKKKDMLLVNYEAPDGKKRHNRLWNGGNGIGTIELYSHGKLIDRIHAENIGCEYGEYCEQRITAQKEKGCCRIMENSEEKMNHQDEAERLFREGYNCCQSVFAAFTDVTGMKIEEALRYASAFGAGFGKMREVCGAVSGMTLLNGFLNGYTEADDREGKIQLYRKEQELCHAFEETEDSIICRDLLHLEPGQDPAEPSVRTEEYYQSRPCIKCIRRAAELVDTMEVD